MKKKYRIWWEILFQGILVCLLLVIPCVGFADGIQAEDVQISRTQGVLKGTLLLPETHGPCPAVLLIAGSGPTDRDGNNQISGRTDSLKQLAEGLAQNGIASLRYDKRGIGESLFPGMKEENLVFEDYISDAEAWIQWMKKDPRFSSVVVLGHSEGSLIGAAAAGQTDADAFISIAGIGKPLQKILLDQLQRFAPQAYYEQSREIISELEQGHQVPLPDPSFAVLFRPSVQPYLISEFRYDPGKEISALKIPVLLLQGTHDIQVDPENAQRLKQADPNARLVMIEGMNHVLKLVSMDKEEQLASYSNPQLPDAPQLISEIVRFVRGSDRQK